MKVKSKQLTTYDKEGKSSQTKLVKSPVPIRRITEEHPYEEDLCNVCDEDLFFSSEITKRIAILSSKGDEVTGWVCPTCYTEFDNKDNIQVLMSRTSIQGKS
jgi:hypothetical protein